MSMQFLAAMPDDIVQTVLTRIALASRNIFTAAVDVIEGPLDGTDDNSLDVDQAVARVVEAINVEVNVPFINEEQEAQALEFVVRPIIEKLAEAHKAARVAEEGE